MVLPNSFNSFPDPKSINQKSTKENPHPFPVTKPQFHTPSEIIISIIAIAMSKQANSLNKH